MAIRPILTETQLKASVMGFNGTKNACYDSTFAFYMSYLETKKQSGDYRAMKLAKEHRAWILKQADKLIKTYQRKQPPITPSSAKSMSKKATREAKQAMPPSDLWRTVYDIPLDYYLQRDE